MTDRNIALLAVLAIVASMSHFLVQPDSTAADSTSDRAPVESETIATRKPNAMTDIVVTALEDQVVRHRDEIVRLKTIIAIQQDRIETILQGVRAEDRRDGRSCEDESFEHRRTTALVASLTAQLTAERARNEALNAQMHHATRMAPLTSESRTEPFVATGPRESVERSESASGAAGSPRSGARDAPTAEREKTATSQRSCFTRSRSVATRHRSSPSIKQPRPRSATR